MSPPVFSEPILHVDMDSFFVEVERLRHPDLANRPVVVGGAGGRGVVASASYQARSFGIHSAMPMARARRLCPQLVVVPSDHRAYQEMSERVFSVFRSFTPAVEGMSLDEAFLDVSGLRRHRDSPVTVGEEVRRRLRSELSLPASVGVASNKLVAKLASEAAKPDGLRHVPVAEQLDFLHALPVRTLFGIGEVTHAALVRLGVETVGDLAAVPEAVLTRPLGRAMAAALHALAGGRDDRPVVPDREARSVSVEETYAVDLITDAELTAELLRQADRLSGRLRRAGLGGRTVTLKVRFPDFTTLTRSHTLAASTHTAHHIYQVGRGLLEQVPRAGRPVRLIGVGMSNLEPTDAPRQLEVTSDHRWDDLEAAMASVRERFGDPTVMPARMVPPPPGSH